MSQDWYADVLEFHRKLAPNRIGNLPAVPDLGTAELRYSMVEEEFAELETALARGDLPGIADAVADMIYVGIGLAISYGIDLRPVWDAVQAANMAKEGGPTREDGKILKPEGWQPPNVAGILARQHGLNGGKLVGAAVMVAPFAILQLDVRPNFLRATPTDKTCFGNWLEYHETGELPPVLSPTFAEIEAKVSEAVGYRVRVQGVSRQEIFFDRVPDPTPAPVLANEAMVAFLARRGIPQAEAEAMTEAQAIARMWAILETEVNPDAVPAEAKAEAVMDDGPTAIPPGTFKPSSAKAIAEQIVGRHGERKPLDSAVVAMHADALRSEPEVIAPTAPAICGGCDGEEAFAEPEVFASIDNEVS